MTEVLLLLWNVEICHWLQWILSAKAETFTMFVTFSTFNSNIKMIIIKKYYKLIFIIVFITKIIKQIPI